LRRNRTIVGLKLAIQFLSIMSISRNRTIVGLKRYIVLTPNSIIESQSHHSGIETKIVVLVVFCIWVSRNRTIVGLKRLRRGNIHWIDFVAIAP